MLLVLLFLVVLALVYFEISEEFDQSILLFVSESVGNPVLDVIMQSYENNVYPVRYPCPRI